MAMASKRVAQVGPHRDVGNGSPRAGQAKHSARDASRASWSVGAQWVGSAAVYVGQAPHSRRRVSRRMLVRCRTVLGDTVPACRSIDAQWTDRRRRMPGNRRTVPR